MKTDWKKVLLGDYCEIILGGTPNTKNPSYWGGNIPWASVADFNVNKVIYTTQKTITEKGLNESNTKLLKVGDIIISARGTVGKTVVCGVPMAFNQSCYALRSTSKELLQDFLYYLINYHVNQLKKKATGGVFDTIVTDTLKNFEIKIPNFYIQQKIAAILSAYDDLIENNLRRIKILEEMARTIYREWFVKFRFPGHEKVRMVDSPLGKIPEGWEVKPLADLVETQYGYTESAQERPVGPKFLRGTDINKNTYIDWSSVPYCSINKEEYPRFKLNKNDIVVIRMADPGKVGIIEVDIDAVFASYLVRLKILNKSITPYYLFYFLLSDLYQGYITGASTGTTRKSASAGVIVGINIVVPPEPILEKFESIIFPLRAMLNKLLNKNEVLRQTRDLLLPKLISGEIDVSELDIKIPETERS